mgnify:CR=1 FL=1
MIFQRPTSRDRGRARGRGLARARVVRTGRARRHGGARRQLSLELAGTTLTPTLERLHDGATVLQLGAERWPFSARALGGAWHDVQLGLQRVTLAVYAHDESYAVFAPQGSALIREHDALAHAGDAAAVGGRLTAPMPGKVVSFLAKPGDRVQRGQALAVMEAMKMEHTISAPHDGVVEELLYGPGDQVAEGGELLRLAKS